jgi:hypothetical protein
MFMTTPAQDAVVEANRKLLLDRSNFGINKYGVTLEKSSLTEMQLVQHALEEALDLANYLQGILQHLKKKQNVEYGGVVTPESILTFWQKEEAERSARHHANKPAFDFAKVVGNFEGTKP